MAKEQKTIKLYRESDGAKKEYKEHVFKPYMKSEHLKRGFRIVAEFSDEAPKEKAENPVKPIPNIPEAIAKAKVEADAKEEVEPEGPAFVESEAVDLNTLKVSELRKLAAKANVQGYVNMKKTELVEALS